MHSPSVVQKAKVIVFEEGIEGRSLGKASTNRALLSLFATNSDGRVLLTARISFLTTLSQQGEGEKKH